MSGARHAGRSGRGSALLTLGAGGVIILGCAILLLVDVASRGGAVVPRDALPEPLGAPGAVTRAVAVNMTPLSWIGYLLLLDGLLEILGRRGARTAASGSPLRRRPRRVVLCFLTGIPLWCFFDGVNFSILHAWRYHGLPESALHRGTGYFVAFGAISPGLLLTAELLRRTRLGRWSGRPLRIGARGRTVILALGVLFVAFPFAVRDPVGTVTLWLSVLFLLDPINHRLGAPSLIGDWAEGRYGRTAALLVAGAICGVLWELWNYWAAAKWTYHLPFLGPLEPYRLFEMPLAGFGGFLPFALECWVFFQTAVLIFDRIGVTGLRDRLADQAVL